MTLDARPIWIIAAICSAGFGFLVLLLRRNYADYLARALTYWSLAYLCFACMFTIWLGGAKAGPFLYFVVARMLAPLGLGFEYRAVTALKRQAYSLGWMIYPPLLMGAIFFSFLFIYRNITIGLILFNLLDMILMLRIALSFVRPENDRRPFPDMLAAGTYAALAVSTGIVIVDFIRNSHFTREYDFNAPRSLYNTVAAIVVEGIVFGVFLLAVSERLNLDFKFQAMHDPLTELFNRRAFEKIGEHEVSSAARTGLPLSLFLVDIDHFQRFNDAYGHAIGVFILRAAADTLRQSLRDEDYLCRWGGDEFCALLPRASRDHAELVARRAIAAFEAIDISVGGEPIQVEISIGIVTRDIHEVDFSLLMLLADAALDQAKERGLNQFAIA